jgi:ribonuclease Z
MARVIFLGTAAALPFAHQTNTALALLPDDPSSSLLIDCGGDVYGALLRAGLGPDTIADLLVTHAHIDHIGSLPSLIESFRLGGRRRPLRIYAIPEVMAVIERLLDVFSYELTLDNWPYAVTLDTVDQGQERTLAGMPARVFRMDHSIPSIGVRLELPNGVVAYTCDTQPNPNLSALGRNAQILVTECTFLHQHAAFARASKHLTALEAGQCAADCGAQMLALVHRGMEGDATAARDEAAQAFSGAILSPTDGDVVEV